MLRLPDNSYDFIQSFGQVYRDQTAQLPDGPTNHVRRNLLLYTLWHVRRSLGDNTLTLQGVSARVHFDDALSVEGVSIEEQQWEAVLPEWDFLTLFCKPLNNIIDVIVNIVGNRRRNNRLIVD